MPSRTLAPIAAALFALLLSAPVRLWSAAQFSPPEIGLLLRFDSPPSDAFVSAMQGELARIMSAADLKLRWLTPETSDGKQTFARALVVTFHGACRALPVHLGARRPGANSVERISLAETLANETSILPYSEVNCDRLRGFLATEQPAGAGVEGRLGFAMARVMAHEMYHVLLQTRTHGRRGISKEVHTPAALLSKSLRFDADELSRIRARFRPFQASIAPTTQQAVLNARK